MLLSPAGVVETTVVVAVEPSAFDSCDDTGFRVDRGVRTSGAPEGAVVRWEVASACPEGAAALSGTFALVSGLSPAGSEDVGAVPFVGAVIQAGRAGRGRGGGGERISFSCVKFIFKLTNMLTWHTAPHIRA